MRTALLILIFLHTLLHLLGFAKAFGVASFEPLRMPISRPMGVL